VAPAAKGKGHGGQLGAASGRGRRWLGAVPAGRPRREQQGAEVESERAREGSEGGERELRKARHPLLDEQGHGREVARGSKARQWWPRPRTGVVR